MVIGNKTIVCQDPRNIEPTKVFWKENPLHFTTPLLLLQLFLISFFSLLMDLSLRPLGQSTIVAQILAGMLFGPTALGHKQLIGTKLFPMKSYIVLETIASFGIMFLLFVVSVQMDIKMMTRPGRRAIYIALTNMFVSLASTVGLAFILMKYVPMNPKLSSSLPYLAVGQCLTPFPNIVCLLTELKILNTDLGRLAISTALVCDVIGIAIIAICFAIMLGGSSGDGSSLAPLWSIISALIILGIVIFAVRPAITLALNRLPQGKPVGEFYIRIIFMFVLISGFASEVAGQHYAFGPIVLGLVVPEGPPLGSAISTKLDYPINKVLYPAYLTTSGLKTNLFTIDMEASWVVAVIIIYSVIIKIIVVWLPSHFSKLKFKDAFVLGLILNARGVSELIIYNLWRDTEILTNDLFALSVISVILITAIISPMIKYLYDPSKQHIPTKRRSIHACKRYSDLRVLVCIHGLENLTSMINLMEASHASEQNLIQAVVVILVELVGRAAPVFTEHTSFSETTTTNENHDTATQIVSALHQYKQSNENRTTLRMFSSITYYETMHDDICKLARDHKSSIIIIPFHKQFAIDGSFGSINRGLRGVNYKVLERAPCTVGILVDRGILNGSISILANQTLFHVAVIYIGGPDGVESLAYGDRMARKENVKVTIIRFLLFGSDNARQRKFDNDRIEEIRRVHVGSQRLWYREEVVRDGVGLAMFMRGLEERFDLMIVGRNHPNSPLLNGLETRNEHPELGVLGEMLASPDFGSTASLLILHQPNLLHRVTVMPVVNEHDTTVHHQSAVRPSAVQQSTGCPSTIRPSAARRSIVTDLTPRISHATTGVLAPSPVRTSTATIDLTPRSFPSIDSFRRMQSTDFTPVTEQTKFSTDLTPPRGDGSNSNDETWAISIDRS